MLKDLGIPKVWAPCMIDAALNHCCDAKNLDEIVRSKQFLDECKSKLSETRWLSEFTWSPEALVSGCHGRIPLLQAFVEKSMRSIAKKLGWSNDCPTMLEEFASIVMEQIQSDAYAYLPGKVADDGTLRLWGYEAFLANFSVNRSINEIVRVTDSHGSISLDAEVDGRTIMDSLENIMPDAVACTQHAPAPVGSAEFRTVLEEAADEVFSSTKQSTADDAMLYLLYLAGDITLSDLREPLRKPTNTLCVRLQNMVDRVFDTTKELVAAKIDLSPEDARIEVLGYAWGHDQKPLPQSPEHTAPELRIALDSLFAQDVAKE